MPTRIRFSLLATLATAFALAHSAEPQYPLWDNHEPIADYAKRVNLPPTKKLDLGNGVKLDLVLIPAGKFIMGTPEPEKPIVGQTMSAISGGILFIVVAVWLIRAWRKRKRPQFSVGLMLVMTFVAAIGVWGGVRWNKSLHRPLIDLYDHPDQHPEHSVTLTRPFYMGKYVVTQEQYQAVIVKNSNSVNGKDNPVDDVSWDDAQLFCTKMTELTHQVVRLPTEAEWEYACRAGTTTEYYSGDTEADLSRVAWYWDEKSAHPVGQKDANAFGLYDMHGNVWQWCQDFYDEDYYSKSPTENPQGPSWSEIAYVMRGGSWHNSTMCCRSAYRGVIEEFGGFRVVVSATRTP